MNTDLTILKSIDINSSPTKIWEVLTNPKMIEQYFIGAETITNWEVGNEIIFIHIYKGEKFINKGVVIEFNPGHLLSYTYWTAFSNTEDKPENYTIITYKLSEINDKTNLTLTQINFKSIEWYQGLEIGWNKVLAKIKEIAENSNDRQTAFAKQH
jgi:uncharacterized protein YndB with AHSA1/START domain